MVEDERFPGELLDALDAEVPPAGFADRVMAARRAETAPSPRRRWRPRLVVGLAFPALLAAVIVLFASSIPMKEAGGLAAEARAEHAVGKRGVAVLEAGAEVAWAQEFMGAVRVKQPRGAVFYRVEPGASFIVETPAGEVRVTGTSFKVEVPMPGAMRGMKMNAASGALGAVLATVAWVTVYEGSVEVSSTGEAVTLAAGERAELRPDAAPAKLAPGESRAELLEARRALKDQVDTLEGQLKELMIARANGEDPVVARNRQLEAEVSALREQLEVEELLRRESEGEKIAFPEGLSDRYREAALKRSFEEVFAKTGLPGEVRAIDCSEYPCIVFGEFTTTQDADDTTDTSQRFFDALDGPYPEAENNKGISHSRFRTKKDDGTVEQKSVFGVTVTPKSVDEGSEEHRKKVNRRVRWRNQQYMDAYQ